MRVYLKDIPKCWVCESCACPLGEPNIIILDEFEEAHTKTTNVDVAALACEPNIIILDEFEETYTKTKNVDVAASVCEPNIIILDEFEETDTKTTNINVASVLGQQPPPATTESQGSFFLPFFSSMSLKILLYDKQFFVRSLL